MNPTEIRQLLVVCHGYWPSSAPADDDLTLAAWLDLLETVSLPKAVAATKRLARTGRDFCPTPGAIYAESIRPEPPERKPYVPELPTAEDDDLDVPALLAEARKNLHAASSPADEIEVRS